MRFFLSFTAHEVRSFSNMITTTKAQQQHHTDCLNIISVETSSTASNSTILIILRFIIAGILQFSANEWNEFERKFCLFHPRNACTSVCVCLLGTAFALHDKHNLVFSIFVSGFTFPCILFLYLLCSVLIIFHIVYYPIVFNSPQFFFCSGGWGRGGWFIFQNQA